MRLVIFQRTHLSACVRVLQSHAAGHQYYSLCPQIARAAYWRSVTLSTPHPTPTAHLNCEKLWAHSLSPRYLLLSRDPRHTGVQSGVVATGLKVVATNMVNKGDLHTLECKGDGLMRFEVVHQRVKNVLCLGPICHWFHDLRIFMFSFTT